MTRCSEHCGAELRLDNAFALIEGAPNPVLVGGIITYTYTISNAGPQAAQNARLHDVLPAGISFSSFGSVTGGGVCVFSFGPRTLECLWSSLAPAASVQAQIMVSVDQPGPIVNTATTDSQTVDPNMTNNSSTASTSTVVGTPRISGRILAKGRDASGAFFVDLQLTNTGTGNARNLMISQILLRTLSGSGTVSYNTTLSPPLPIPIGSLNVGASATIRLYLEVPTTVMRFSITENGTVQDAVGTNYTFSTAQAVYP